MGNCTRPTDGCLIKQKLLERLVEMESCDDKGTISCFTLERNTKFFSMENLRQSSCRLLISSIAFESVGMDARIALELERVRLSWWLKGDCRNVTCSKNAVCTQVDTPGGNSGHRCSCPEGHHGDGFIHPCRKGNPILCGLPTNGSCSYVEDEDTAFDMVVFFWSLTVAYVTVFVGFLVLLSFESPPRQAWLSLVDNFIHVARRALG
ncbi:unnamed protein product [Arabidopsis lyrata]|nr:unnamed protein product [Arabidopsis lyrata]